MNENGFTLIELIAVFVLIALVSMITLPNLSNLMKNNNEKEFKTYEDMMVEYTKTVPNYKNKMYVCLKDLNIKPINDKITCNGYVTTTNNKLTPYLYCIKNGEETYKTNDYSLPDECR